MRFEGRPRLILAIATMASPAALRADAASTPAWLAPGIGVVLLASAGALFLHLYRLLTTASRVEKQSRARAGSIAKLAEAQVRDAELRYQALFEVLPVPIGIVASDGRVHAANPAFLALVGVSSVDELDHAGALSARIAGDRDFERTTEFIAENGVVEQRVWKLRVHGGEAVVTVHGVMAAEPRGAFQLTLTDVTELRRAETQVVDLKMQMEQTRLTADARVRDLLDQSMEMAAVRDRAVRLARRRTEILAGLGAELQRQVAPITNATPTMRNLVTGKGLEVVELVSGAADSLAATVEDLREFSRVESGQLELASINFSLRSLVESVADEFADRAEAQGIEMVCRIRPDVPDAVIGDPARIRQIVFTLLANAVEHTHAGEVAVNVSVARDGATDAVVRIEVEDSGEGIPPEASATLFDLAPAALSAGAANSGAAWQTSARARSGRFGLAMARHLVERMSGQIGVESEPGQGTLFWLAIRLAKLVAPGDQTVDLSVLRGKRALVVDDAPSCRGVLVEILRNWGLAADTAEQSMEAVDRCQKAAAAGTPFHFVLLDYELPGMNGLETAEAIMDLQAGSSILLTIPPSLRHWREEPFLHGIRAALSKPVHAGDLYAALRECLPEMTIEAPAETPAAATATEEPGHTAEAAEPPADQTAADLATLGEAISDEAILGPELARPEEIDLPAPVVAIPAPQAEANVTPCVLLAEDNLVNQRVARRLVEKMGYRVEVVDDGRKAVNAAQNGKYALILMDCQMPEMDGLSATAEIRKLESPVRNIPIVAMTANSMRGDRERCLDAGMNDYVSKPVAFETLHSVLSYWLTRTGAAPAARSAAASA
ncbi:MAG: response regulator [Bryobacteraceae bacterium]